MILPTKGIAPRFALLTISGQILRVLIGAKTVSRLWEDFRKADDTNSKVTYDWFLLALDLLYMMDAIELERGRIYRRPSAIEAAT